MLHICHASLLVFTQSRVEPNHNESESIVDDCAFVVEDNKGCRGKKRRASGTATIVDRRAPLKPGPPHLAAALASIRSAAKAVDALALSSGIDLYREHPATLGQVVYVTTSYSGIGTAEAGAADAMEQLRAVRATRGFNAAALLEMRMHGAVECDDHCIQALKMHAEQSRARHIFVDINDRIPSSLLASLRQDLTRLRRKVETHYRLTMQFKGCQAAEKDRVSWVAELGKQFVQRAMKELKALDWSECSQSWCVAHGKLCPLKPAAGPEDVWIEIAGSTCVAWSSMSKSRWGWLDASSIPCLVWAAWVAHARPDCIIHENVRSFDWTFFNALDIIDDNYWVASACHSPVDQGIPANRPRRYTILLSKSLRMLTIPGSIATESETDLDPLRPPQFCCFMVVAASGPARLTETTSISFARAWFVIFCDEV